MRRAFGAVVLLLLSAVALPAQERPVFPSPILTIDQDRLYSGSAFGARVRAELEAASAELAAENRRIEADLIAEERKLTDQRPGLPAEEFRALADAFDEKVQGIRAEQDAKSRRITRIDETERQRFYGQIVNILGEIVRERGAVAIIERRSVFLAADQIDITNEAIARINASLGDGAEPEPEPEPEQELPAPE